MGHMEKDIAKDMAGDAPLEGGAPCQSSHIPKGTAACGRTQIKRQGTVERNYYTTTLTFCHRIKGIVRNCLGMIL